MPSEKSDQGKEIEPVGPLKGEFITPAETTEADEKADALPQQEEFWRPPIRFGSIPIEKEPLGWDRRKGFRKLFPQVMLPFQVVERVAFGHPELEPNRLFWGDNLHVMRQLPSESIEVIYIDPPFFSGRQYNVIFGDQNELRSFSDIWEDGMPGYLIWLNARLYEMKRLLNRTGSIYVHLDGHAVHYVKMEMDKIFGHDNFMCQIVWKRSSIRKASSKKWLSVDDVILVYCKNLGNHQFNTIYIPFSEQYKKRFCYEDEVGKYYWIDIGTYSEERLRKLEAEGRVRYPDNPDAHPRIKHYLHEAKGVQPDNVWVDISPINSQANESYGYPTQKPEALLERIIQASSKKGDMIADFFCGGGTAAAVAQRLGRRWTACDQSRVAVAITEDRLTRQVEEQTGKLFPIPDFTVEHWGVYEAQRLSEAPCDHFRAFVLRAFGALVEGQEGGIHGYKGAIPIWVGDPDQKRAVTSAEVQAFANAIRKTLRYKQDNLRDGIMLAWAFRPDAQEAADRLRRLEQTDLNFIRLDMVRIDSPRFREHIAARSTDHADYENFLTFVQSPKVEVGFKRISSRTYILDVSETIVMNPGGKIINVQWDFDYGKRFSSTPGYSFVRTSNREPELRAQYEFPATGKKRIACRVQDDMGGEGLWTAEIEVE